MIFQMTIPLHRMFSTKHNNTTDDNKIAQIMCEYVNICEYANVYGCHYVYFCVRMCSVPKVCVRVCLVYDQIRMLL